MVLNLEAPIGSNFIKDWPDQNAVNCNEIDAYAGPCLLSDGLQDYTPVLTATVTNPTLGTGGTLIGKYYRIFDQIYSWGEFRFGTGGNVGNGTYRISLPFRARTLISDGSIFDTPIPVGNGIAFQVANDSNRQPLIASLGTENHLVFTVRMGLGGSTRGVTHNNPFAWTGAPAPADGIQWGIKYKVYPGL